MGHRRHRRTRRRASGPRRTRPAGRGARHDRRDRHRCRAVSAGRHQHRPSADRNGRLDQRTDRDGRHRQRRESARTRRARRRCPHRARYVQPRPRRVRRVTARPARCTRQDRPDSDLPRAPGKAAGVPHRDPRRGGSRDAHSRARPRTGPPTNDLRTSHSRKRIAGGARDRRGRHRQITTALRPAGLARTARRTDPTVGRSGSSRPAGRGTRAHSRRDRASLRDPRQRLADRSRTQTQGRVRQQLRLGRGRHGVELARTRHDRTRDHRIRAPRGPRTSDHDQVVAAGRWRNGDRGPARGSPLGRPGVARPRVGAGRRAVRGAVDDRRAVTARHRLRRAVVRPASVSRPGRTATRSIGRLRRHSCARC